MIFEDTSHRRWQITQRIGLFLLVCGASLGVLYAYSSYRSFVLPATADVLNTSPGYSWMSSYTGADTAAFAPFASTTERTQQRAKEVTPSPFSIKSLQKKPGYVTMGFLVQADRASLASFTAHADKMDIVVPDWYSLPKHTTTDCQITEQINEEVRYLLHQTDVSIIPRLSNYAADKWQVDQLRTLLRTPSKRSCLAESIADAVRRTDSKGVNIDFEELSAEDRPSLTEFFLELADRLHRQQQLLTIDIPVNASAFDLHALSILSDATILMAYDQHDPTSRPGPIAAQDWVRASLERTLALIPPEKLILGTASYGYNWNINTPNLPANSASYKQLIQLAHNASAKPTMETASQNMRFGYTDSHDQKHEVWLLDENTHWNQHRLIQKHALAGASLWRLGSEDPALWAFFGQTTTGTLAKTSFIEPLDTRQLQHESEVFTMAAAAQTGEVQRHSNEEGEILGVNYLRTPNSYTIERIGQPIPKEHLMLAFTGPLEPLWTPKILDLLTTSSVPAMFFLTKDQAEDAPKLVQEIARRGFLIGSVATAAAQQSLSPTVIHTELNQLQQKLISLTGKKTTLFQVPLRKTYSILDQSAARTLEKVSQLGYVSIDSDIILEYTPDASAEQLISALDGRLAHQESRIVTMHNFNSEQAIALLPPLLEQLKIKGAITSLDQAIQLPRERLEPSATLTERIQSSVLNVAGRINEKKWNVIMWIFLFTNVLSMARILFLAIFALRTKHLKKRPSNSTRQTLITVVIPAYNEEKTIRRTIAGVQHSTHTNFIVMVVNDGSTDRTAQIVEQMHKKDPRIQLINKPNAGKFSALNIAFQNATTDIVVTIDADTILYPRTLDALIMPFEDPLVDAVCGNVEVGNVCNLLTGFQALEYITSQNFDRRAFEALNCIGVVPGATGAWRRQRVLEIGGYEADTLVEDADVTLRLLQHGGKIVYAPEARSRTEAPSTIEDLSKQRLRWSFGTFQCLRKHAKSFFHGTLGWIALPNIFFFQILYPILSPIGDLVFIWALFTGQIRSIIVGYLFFIFIDFVGSVLAFRLEKRSPKLLLLIFIQRFFYRQFMYIIAFRSILRILRGTRQGWNKLTRVGSVHATLRKRTMSQAHR